MNKAEEFDRSYARRMLDTVQAVMLFPFGLSKVEICSRTRLTREEASQVLEDLVSFGWLRHDVVDEAHATRDVKGRFSGSVPGVDRWVIEPNLLLRIFRSQKAFFIALQNALSAENDGSGRSAVGEFELRELARHPVEQETFIAWVRAIDSNKG